MYFPLCGKGSVGAGGRLSMRPLSGKREGGLERRIPDWTRLNFPQSLSVYVGRFRRRAAAIEL
jgi:hypothetical protein